MNKKLSGSEFRKRAAKRLNDEVELLKKVPKIGSFFKTPSSTTSNPTVSTTSANRENVSYSCHDSELPTSEVGIIGLSLNDTTATESQVINEELCNDQLNIVGLQDNNNSLSNEFVFEDPATWKIRNSQVIENIVENSPKQNLQADFSKSERVYPDQKRTLSLNLFKGVLPNGETYFRDWLLFSASTGKLFCVPCCLFQPDNNKTVFVPGLPTGSMATA